MSCYELQNLYYLNDQVM